MNSFRFALSVPFGLLVVGVLACANDTPAASPDDTVSSADLTPTAEPVDAPPTGDSEMIEEPAPIESVTISIAESFPPQYFVHIISGLPNGCPKYNGYEMDRSNETITIDVTNRVPKPGQFIACTEIYGFHEENINLGSDFEGSVTYTIVVNDKTETFVAQGGEVYEDPPVAVTEPAPIQGVRLDVNTGDTDHLVVTSGLPNNCHEFAEYLARRTDDEIVVELLNYRYDMQMVEVVDADGAKYMRREPIVNIACVKIYRTVETEIEIGSNIKACNVYTVKVNGETWNVQAIAPNVRCANPDQSIDRRTSIIATIESAQVASTKSIPPQHALVIRSGLPNGCTEFGEYEVEQQGNEIRVTITNTIPTATNILCTQQYRTVDTRITLGSDFESGDYSVVINGEATAKFSHVAHVRPGTGQDNIRPIPAPIDDVLVISTRSIPPRHTLVITSSLPNGCAEFDSYDIKQDGYDYRVRVTNTEPTGEVVCTDDYRTVVTRVDLGSELESGGYTVDVNGTTTTFSHIGLPKLPAGTRAAVLAPIERISIEASGGMPNQYTAHITSGLLNGCHRFDKYVVSREGTVIKIRVTNTLPANPAIMCTMVYGLVDTAVPLGSDFEIGTTYTVDANGETTTFTDRDGPGITTRRVVAPIIRVKVNEAKSYPVQFFAVVESRQSNACVVPDGYEEVRTDNVIEISVFNREPSGPETCPTTAQFHVSNIPLGASFEPGKKYTVVVNGDTATTFVAQGTPPDGPTNASVGSPFNLPVGQTLQVGEVRVRFDEVLEDSRCPTNVICVWQGRARIQILVGINGTGDNPTELMLEGAREDLSLQVVDKYGVRLEALNPYPGSTGKEKPEYVATLTVIEMMPDDATIELQTEPNRDNPRTIHFFANIVGGAENSRQLYCGGFEWSFDDGSPGLAATPSCVPWTPEVKIPRVFTISHVYEKAGMYEASFSYGPLGPVNIKVEVK